MVKDVGWESGVVGVKLNSDLSKRLQHLMLQILSGLFDFLRTV